MEEQTNEPKYVVIRNGIRVSDKDYLTPNEEKIIAERNFWQNVVTNFPDGTNVEIVRFDKKKHRIW
jgi:hypothetical protein